jgi:hypothetical protein
MYSDVESQRTQPLDATKIDAVTTLYKIARSLPLPRLIKLASAVADAKRRSKDGLVE